MSQIAAGSPQYIPAVTKDHLFVLVPGMGGSPKSLFPLKALVGSKFHIPEQSWVEFSYKAAQYSNRDCHELARSLSLLIDREYSKRPEPKPRIVIIAHSMGTAIARRAFLDAMGYGSKNLPQYEWQNHVERIVLAGAIGRGIDFDTMRSRWRRIFKAFSRLGAWIGVGGTGLQMLRGSPFISQLRMDWIRYNQKEARRPCVYHLLGTADEISTRDDVIDVDQFDNVRTIDVEARHNDIIMPNKDTSYHLLAAFGEFAPCPRLPESGHDTVIFLLHGIRDSKSCFANLAGNIERGSQNKNNRVRIVMPGYKRFSLLDFLSKKELRKVTAWFADQYTQELARNPNAVFHFAGHSNGTRVLGLAVDELPRMAFENVYLAASPLPQNYDWTNKKSDGQVKKVRNDRGNADWPVGVIAKALGRLGFGNIGFRWPGRFFFL